MKLKTKAPIRSCYGDPTSRFASCQMWTDKQKTSSWWCWLNCIFQAPATIKRIKYFRIKARTCCCPQKIDQPLLSHRAGSRPSTPSMVSVPWKKGNLLLSKEVAKSWDFHKNSPNLSGGSQTWCKWQIIGFWEISPIIIAHEVWLCFHIDGLLNSATWMNLPHEILRSCWGFLKLNPGGGKL